MDQSDYDRRPRHRDDDRDRRSQRSYDDRDDRRRSHRDEYDDRSARHGDDRSDYRRDDRDRRRRDDDYGRGDRDYRRGGRDDYRDGGRRDRGRGDGRDGYSRDSPDRRSPTPEGAIPLSKRVRRKTLWDIHGQGLENMSALQAKQMGLYHPPGPNRQHGPQYVIDPDGTPRPLHPHPGGGPGHYPNRMGFPGGPGGPGGFPGGPMGGPGGGGGGPGGPGFPHMHLNNFGSHGGPRQFGGPTSGGPGGPPGVSGGPSASSLNMARQRKRLYVGNVTYDCNEQNLGALFNEKMHEIGFAKNDEGEPVVGVSINHDKSYAFVEFRTPQEATSAMVFDNIVFANTLLKIRRPKDYVPEEGSEQGAPYIPGVVSSNVPDSPNKIFIGGLPSYLNDEQVMELLKSFGDLKAFNLVKENGDPDRSKGFAFCEYVDPELTEVAIQGLNNMELGDRYLVVQRASVGKGASNGPNGSFGSGGNNAPLGGPRGPGSTNPMNLPLPAFATAQNNEPISSRAIVMLNMVTPEELLNDEEYVDILEDITEECSKYGEVEELRIPRPTKKEKKYAGSTDKAESAEIEAAKRDEEAGVGRVYVLFKTLEGARAGVAAIAGRQFGGRQIICAALDESEFASKRIGNQDVEPAHPTESVDQAAE
ncbi:Splicing factor U2AF, large subunit (RRM superfamily) [Phaffia rhodozyma]|uniref:Splicing factor U2AF, large subunit (RRM superfamily) n=1 Tax=Phaffia rhodozyma TaxID=264483 RepID=A0A0F7SQM8_PHARH|nr:Splicing factor U2AF, large subunit (RRM superfamily) [Phaffia rhodozyma]